jgi:hypothetical protein
MWGKISDDIFFKCGHCGKVVNPYVWPGFLGVSPEEAFCSMPPCPDCYHREWINNN